MISNTKNEHNFLETGVGPITDHFVNLLINKISTSDIKDKLAEKVVDPAVVVIKQKIKPYIYVSLGLYLIIILLLIFIIFLIYKKK